MKKILTLIVALAMMTMVFAACGKDAADSSAPGATEDSGWQFERKIEIICPWGNGGGADTTARTFATALEKELGVPVVVNNKAGAGGVTGVEFATSQPADGYTFLICTPSPLLAQVTGATNFDVYGKINPLTQLVHDCNILVAGKDAPYNTYAELMAHVEANPGSVKAGVMSITGLDGACIEAAFGDKVEAVAYTEGAQLNADVIGGHVGLAVVGPAEVAAMVQSGDMKVIMSFTEERLTMPGYENVEAAGEIGVESYFGPARGIFYANGTPEGAVKAFEAAAQRAVSSEEFQTWAKSEGLDQRPGWKNTADYKTAWDADYQDFVEMFGNK
ncbi:MAG: tripartite tricarboxylate transporter substrate binding protein [Candidatus Fimivivens sp.]